jgi:hypothetical protein
MTFYFYKKGKTPLSAPRIRILKSWWGISFEWIPKASYDFHWRVKTLYVGSNGISFWSGNGGYGVAKGFSFLSSIPLLNLVVFLFYFWFMCQL